MFDHYLKYILFVQHGITDTDDHVGENLLRFEDEDSMMNDDLEEVSCRYDL